MSPPPGDESNSYFIYHVSISSFLCNLEKNKRDFIHHLHGNPQRYSSQMKSEETEAQCVKPLGNVSCLVGISEGTDKGKLGLVCFSHAANLAL